MTSCCVNQIYTPTATLSSIIQFSDKIQIAVFPASVRGVSQLFEHSSPSIPNDIWEATAAHKFVLLLLMSPSIFHWIIDWNKKTDSSVRRPSESWTLSIQTWLMYFTCRTQSTSYQLSNLKSLFQISVLLSLQIRVSLRFSFSLDQSLSRFPFPSVLAQPQQLMERIYIALFPSIQPLRVLNSTSHIHPFTYTELFSISCILGSVSCPRTFQPAYWNSDQTTNLLLVDDPLYHLSHSCSWIDCGSTYLPCLMGE